MFDFMLIVCIVGHASAELINGLEGRNLLSALTEFTEAAVRALPKVDNRKSEAF